MSDHLLLHLDFLYRIYTVDDIKGDYYSFDFLPNYNSIEVDTIYDILNCLDNNSLNNLLVFIFKQWSLFKIDPEKDELSTTARRNYILSKNITITKINNKYEFNKKLTEFIDYDSIFGIYIINQMLKFLYPCKL